MARPFGQWAGLHPVINVGGLEAGAAGMVYRDVNIALVNELASIAEVVGLDIWPLLAAANTDGETGSCGNRRRGHWGRRRADAQTGLPTLTSSSVCPGQGIGSQV
jgi:hypothetical protein